MRVSPCWRSCADSVVTIAGFGSTCASRNESMAPRAGPAGSCWGPSPPSCMAATSRCARPRRRPRWRAPGMRARSPGAASSCWTADRRPLCAANGSADRLPKAPPRASIFRPSSRPGRNDGASSSPRCSGRRRHHDRSCSTPMRRGISGGPAPCSRGRRPNGGSSATHRWPTTTTVARLQRRFLRLSRPRVLGPHGSRCATATPRAPMMGSGPPAASRRENCGV